MPNGNSNVKMIVGVVSVAVALFVAWTGAVYTFANHSGNESIHTPLQTKQSIAQEAAKNQTDALRRELQPTLKSLERRLEAIENSLERQDDKLDVLTGKVDRQSSK